MIDRLKELRSLNPTVKPLEEQVHLISEKTEERMKNYEVPKQGIEQQFFENIKSAKNMMNRIKENNEKIEDLRKKYNKAIQAARQKQSTDQLDEIIAGNRVLHQKLKLILDYLKKSVEEAEKQQPEEPETRMKKNFYISITRELANTLKSESVKEDSFKTSVKDKITRHVKQIDPTLNQNQIQKYVQNPESANQMLQKKIYGEASVNLKNAVSDIQDKFRDIQRLEQAVSQCLILFRQLALLVQKQGEMIDDVELNVNQTKDYMEKANVHLQKAKQHHQCSKKLMCIILIVAVVILAILLGSILGTTLKK